MRLQNKIIIGIEDEKVFVDWQEGDVMQNIHFINVSEERVQGG